MADNGVDQNKVRVAVVDDEEDVRRLMQDVLARTPEFKCVGCFANASDALAGLPNLEPDLVLLDVRMPGLTGIECTAALKRLMPWVKTIMVTGIHDADSVAKSSSAGAEFYLTKPVTPDQLVATLRFVFKGPPSDLSPLSQRENEFMRWLAAGLLYKEIADRLGISEAVVHKLQHKIFVKLHVNNKVEAISKWRGERGG